MSDNSFDALSKMAAKSVTRRQSLRGLAAVLGGALLTAVGARTAVAAPQLCCICGVGRPCNPKRCVTTTGFPGTGACQAVCGNQGVCQEAHCPQGCPA
jgi:hypothetical protein